MNAWDWLLILALAGIGLVMVWVGFQGGWQDIGYTMPGQR
jgi:hypothetical protein